MEENKARPLVLILKRYKTGVGGINTRFSFECANYAIDAPENATAGTASVSLDDARMSQDKPIVPVLYAEYKYALNNSMYIISYDADDINLPRKQRSEQFVGKLQIVKNNLSYVGYRQSSKDDKKVPVVAILYDHDRCGATDRKMEVAIPISNMSSVLSSRAKNNASVSTGNEEGFPNFYSLYMKIRHEGQENFMEKDKILCLTQENDAAHEMSSDGSIGKYFADVATKVSCKNFHLSFKTPSRKWVVDKIVEGTTDTTEGSSQDMPTSVFNVTNPNTSNLNNSADDNDYMRFGKMSDDIYCCKILSDKIDVATAFMIALSRFDTIQQY